MKPMTDTEKRLTAKNVLAAVKDINKLNKRGYNFLYLCSGFIAHYDINGFKAYYSDHSLHADIDRYAKQNQWSNFKPSDRDYDYYMAKRDCYNQILGGLVAREYIDTLFGDAVKFLQDHVKIIHVKG